MFDNKELRKELVQLRADYSVLAGAVTALRDDRLRMIGRIEELERRLAGHLNDPPYLTGPRSAFDETCAAVGVRPRTAKQICYHALEPSSGRCRWCNAQLTTPDPNAYNDAPSARS